MSGQDLESELRAHAGRRVRDMIVTFDQIATESFRAARRLRERVYGEIYRREREIYPEWIDQGGEA